MPETHKLDNDASPSQARRRLIGESPAFVQQIARLERMAGCDAGVLILGETGTGKELFAQSVHYTSPRAARPLVAVNCGAIPADLVEDELFGHVRGAYTTAHGSRSGLVREAEGGSLFLDDVDCLPLAAQAKLLRFLQEREYRAVGANAVQRANVRVIAASNRDLGQLVALGSFRADLFYRLHVLTLHLPPLRERHEDIADLAQHFIRHFARQFERPVTGATPQALRRLLDYDWPGNVRQLQHLIEGAVLLCQGPQLDAIDIEIPAREHPGQARMPVLPMPPAAIPLAPSESRSHTSSCKAVPNAVAFGEASFREIKARVVREFEHGYLDALLASTQGNVAQAARAAGKDRRALFELIRKHQLLPERYRPAAV